MFGGHLHSAYIPSAQITDPCKAVFNYLCDETAWKVSERAFLTTWFASLEMGRHRGEDMWVSLGCFRGTISTCGVSGFEYCYMLYFYLMLTWFWTGFKVKEMVRLEFPGYWFYHVSVRISLVSLINVFLVCLLLFLYLNCTHNVIRLTVALYVKSQLSYLFEWDQSVAAVGVPTQRTLAEKSWTWLNFCRTAKWHLLARRYSSQSHVCKCTALVDYFECCISAVCLEVFSLNTH